MQFTFAQDIWSGVDPVTNGWVTISADQIAIIETVSLFLSNFL